MNSSTNRSTLRWIAPALVTLFLSGPAFAAAGLPESGVPIVAAPAAPAAPAPATPAAPARKSLPGQATPARKSADDSARYSQREQQATNLQSFKGGEGGVYITSSVLVVALLIVLLVVLL